MIEINGVEIPSPSEFNIGIQDISKSERNASGTMIMEIITTKRKLELSYKYLTKDQLASLLSAINSAFFTVTYTDPEDNAEKTITCYKGDRTCGVLDFQNSIPRYKDVKVNFIER
jgi:hypothetical protein